MSTSSSTTADRQARRVAPDSLAGAAMIVGTSASIQVTAALAHGLFATLGPAGTSALRFTLGAAILFAVVRPGIRGRDGETWWAIARYGVSLAALNLTFFEAIQRLPMGIAVTLRSWPRSAWPWQGRGVTRTSRLRCSPVPACSC